MSGLGQAMWRQARSDLAHARRSHAAGEHDWATFAAQQAAEKALKAALLMAGLAAPGTHDLVGLFDRLVRNGLATAKEQSGLRDALSALVQGWAVSSSPLPGEEIAPVDLVTASQAEAAIAHAEALLAAARHMGLDDE